MFQDSIYLYGVSSSGFLIERFTPSPGKDARATNYNERGSKDGSMDSSVKDSVSGFRFKKDLRRRKEGFAAAVSRGFDPDKKILLFQPR